MHCVAQQDSYSVDTCATCVTSLKAGTLVRGLLISMRSVTVCQRLERERGGGGRGEERTERGMQKKIDASLFIFFFKAIDYMPRISNVSTIM